MTALAVRPAVISDAADVARIYNDGIRARSATFETTERSADDVQSWFADAASERFPFLVACDADGVVLGWVRGGMYRTRECYAGVTDYSIYIADEARGRGVGRTLLGAFIEACAARGVWKVVARVFPTNAASRALHRAHGFREVGVYENHAQLDGVWQDVVIVERLIGTNQG
jgi:L-amino acid N-acyltransferase YncA